ncbi:MAG: tagatose 1,6-diphosphate aldolase [Chloroflexi bacterium]|nr:tagatose 1,6-diphosphate aldolase [Chloroflexota bacterium]
MTQKQTITLGKRRGLSQCADQNGVFNILALDHRQVVKKVFVDRPDPFLEAAEFKREVARTLGPVSTAMLLDPSIGAGPCLADDSLPGACGLIVTVEASGYAGPGHARVSRLPADWSVGAIKRLGASAVKLLVYYHHQSETAPAMRELVSSVSQECQEQDIALFLEILTYSPDPAGVKLSPEGYTDAVIQAASDLTPLGCDILKAEFPVNVAAQPEKRVWEDACQSLSQASCKPWVLLSAGVDYEVFSQQAEIACKAGASGILAGRAIWKEALEVPQSERLAFLQTTGRERMQALHHICGQYATPYPALYQTESLAEDWYAAYFGAAT